MNFDKEQRPVRPSKELSYLEERRRTQSVAQRVIDLEDYIFVLKAELTATNERISKLELNHATEQRLR